MRQVIITLPACRESKILVLSPCAMPPHASCRQVQLCYTSEQQVGEYWRTKSLSLAVAHAAGAAMNAHTVTSPLLIPCTPRDTGSFSSPGT